MTHLLFVSKDAELNRALWRSLKSKGHRATSIKDTDSMPAAIAVHNPDVVLLDMSPDFTEPVLDACRRLRTWSAVAVIVCSECNDRQAKIDALDSGADDYLLKPFDVEELLARIRAMQRRLTPQPGTDAPILRLGDLTIDFHSRQVWLNDELIDLSHKEYELLRALALANGQTVSYKSLLMSIGGKRTTNERSAVRLIVHRLRHKLRDDLKTPLYVLTESGLGYRLNKRLLVNTTPAGLERTINP